MASLNPPTEQDALETEISALTTPNAALFEGDQGLLPVDTRRVLVQLLSGPSVDGRRHTHLWSVLIRDEDTLRSRLHDLFLELIVDRDQQVAFTRQAFPEDVESSILLRRKPLNFLESVLLLYLRQRLTQAGAQGERAVLSAQEMREHLKAFERSSNVDRARFEKHVENAIEKAKSSNLLAKMKGGEERYEVSPTLKLLFSAEDIEALTSVYRKLSDASRAQSPESVESGESEGEEQDEGDEM